MKNFLYCIILTSAFTSLLLSCSQNEIGNESFIEEEVSVKGIKSSFGMDSLAILGRRLAKEFDNHTRANGACELTEEQSRELVQPLINDGRQIQASIIQQITTEAHTNQELISEMENLTELDLATMSLILSATQTTTYESQNDFISANMMISQEKFWPCLGMAVGIADMRGALGKIFLNSGEITVTSFIPFIRTIGKHYLGYLGLAVTIYSFVDCLGD